MSLSDDEIREFRERNKDATEESQKKISDSDMFLAPFGKEYTKDPLCMIQLGIAICLDKPIYLLFPAGVKVPRHLARIASGWEQVTEDGPKAAYEAMERLMKKAKEDLEKTDG